MSLARYMDWITQTALPFWCTHAADDAGLFYETLDLNGKPEPETERRLRTGMRQIHVLAEAAHHGLMARKPALELAKAMAAKLRAIAWSPDGRPGWAATFSGSGYITDARRDLYDHAFALLALGSLARASQDDIYLSWIDQTCAVIDSLQDRHNGGWAESDNHELPRRQNPHMHLFEASLSLYEALGSEAHLARAHIIYNLFCNRFFDGKTGLLSEFFGPAWELSSAYSSERLDPGHMAEWVWLLRRYERLVPVTVGGTCASLLSQGEKLGLTPDGFLADEADCTGRKLVDRRRLWPQTEYLKALIVQGAAGDELRRKRATSFAAHLHETYIKPAPAGTWWDQFTLAGQATMRNIPASTLYHLLVPALEILRLQRH